MTRYTVSPPMLIERATLEDLLGQNEKYVEHLSSLQQIRMSEELVKWCEENKKVELDDSEFEVKRDCCGRCDGVNDVCNPDDVAFPKQIQTMTPFPPSGKIKVTPEESKIVQERLFREGYKWIDGTKEVVKSSYIFWGDKEIAECATGSYFELQPRPEYTMSLFAPVEVVDEWDKAYNDFKETTEYSYCLPLNLYSTFINYLKSHYKIIKL